MDDNITSNVLKFVDNTKLFRKVKHDGDEQHLQNHLDRLVKWSEKWQLIKGNQIPGLIRRKIR